MRSDSPRTVVAALIFQHNRLLICQRRPSDAFPNQWEFPGGKVEPGEEPAAALHRELSEELGISAEIGRQIWRTDFQYPGRAPVHLLFFLVFNYKGTLENRIFQQICWESPQHLPEYDFLAGDRSLIQALASGELEADLRSG